MRIASIEPNDLFRGLDEQGFASFPSAYRCYWCSQGLRFEEQALQRRHVDALKEATVFFALDGSDRQAFEAITDRYVRGLFDRFVTDFRCPRCEAPTVIIWAWNESDDPRTRFAPVTVLIPATWPENRP